MPLKVNTTTEETKARSFDPLPVGWYHMRVTDIEVVEIKKEDSKYKGESRFSIEFEVTDDPRNPQDANGASEFLGRKAFGSTMLAPGTLGWGATDFLRATGALELPKEGVSGEIEILLPDEYEYVGKELMVRMSARKDDKADAAKEKRPVETQPNAYKSANPDEEGTGPSIPATTRRRVL